jgi:hypothetical protein
MKRYIFLIAAAIGLIDIDIYGKTMETNHLIMLCTVTIICYIIYVHDSLEEKINNNKK